MRRKYDRIREKAISKGELTFTVTAPNGVKVCMTTDVSDKKWSNLMDAFSESGRAYYKKKRHERKQRLQEKNR